MKLPKFLRAPFAWRVVSASGVWQYEVNDVSGKRRAWRRFEGGYSPLNWHWLLAGSGMPKVNGVDGWRSVYRETLPDGMIWD